VGRLQYAQGLRQADIMAAGEASTARPRQEKQYDYLLKFLLVGDSDVGKQEILSGLEDGAAESPFCSGSGEAFSSGCSFSDPHQAFDDIPVNSN